MSETEATDMPCWVHEPAVYETEKYWNMTQNGWEPFAVIERFVKEVAGHKTYETIIHFKKRFQ